ncbi:tRNA threonylcarbamoyladenosine dehydratase [Campylobacter sputorum]|uniref:tRNA threonylcarbamoyladenosine dehydratase n=1 Tax=Campylobacter sputorum TaxID=206 RepID=UPI00053BEE0F|nr:ThiF family adenylyltransferase [Campylobacter sputorum]
MDQIDRFSRSRLLFGNKFEKFKQTNILVCGCGGVGGACIEALYRTGFVNLTIIDKDIFEITNQNRQFGSENLGEKKVEVFANKFSGIKPIFETLTPEFIQNFNFNKFDVIIDAIDDMKAKIALAKKINDINLNSKQQIIFISSMGGAKRIDPSKIKISNIWQTTNDPLARKFRSELKKINFSGKFDVVFSTELPKCTSLGSFMGVTATFGLYLASYVVQKICEEE